MPGEKTDRELLNRRKLLKTGVAGFCSLCLAGLFGCGPEEEVKNQVPDQRPAEVSGKGLIGARRSPWYTGLENGTVRCELCPRQCELQAGERGPCRVRENRDGACYSLVYGNPALVQEDPVERKPFFHVLPGSRALSISTAGCNLSCKFCEVWDMALVYPEEVHAYDMPPERVIKHAQAGDVRAVSYAFGEPVVYYEYVSALAEQAKEAGFYNLMHTAAYIEREPLKEIIKKIDAVNVDLKGFDQAFYREYVGGELDVILDNLKLIRDSGVHLEITSILIPTLNDDRENIGAMCRWIAGELGTDIPLHFTRFYPLHKLSALPRTPASKLDEARDMAMDLGLEYVYVSRVTGHEGENTFCPGCGEKVIEREGFVIGEIKLQDGACGSCGTELPGLWA